MSQWLKLAHQVVDLLAEIRDEIRRIRRSLEDRD